MFGEDEFKDSWNLASKLASRVFEMNQSLQSGMTGIVQEHRLEYVGSKEGVHFINDSKATSENALWFALEITPGPIVLIMGGEDHGNTYWSCLPLLHDKVRNIILLAESPIIQSIYREAVLVNSMDKAVATAFAFAQQGDTILLSPACASFDKFENFEDRGRQFKNAYQRI